MGATNCYEKTRPETQGVAEDGQQGDEKVVTKDESENKPILPITEKTVKSYAWIELKKKTNVLLIF